MSIAAQWKPGTIYVPGAIVVPTTVPVAVATPPTNPDFESGNSGWVLGAGWVITNIGTNAFAGSWAATKTGAGSTELENNLLVAVIPGQSISATCRARATGTITNKGNVFIEWLTSGSVRISLSSGNTTLQTNNAWEVSTVTGVAPATAAFARVGALAVVGASGSIVFDSFTWTYLAGSALAGIMYQATQAATGTSAAAEPTWPTVLGNTVVDNTVTWLATVTNRVVWEAHASLVSGAAEPNWPTIPGQVVSDGNVQWTAESRRIPDIKCPHSTSVAIGASKVFAVDKDVVRYCATVNPLDWSSANDAGYLPTGLQQGGNADTKVLALYRANMTAMSASCFQMWQIDPDPAQMNILDQMEGIGSTQHRAAQPVGNDLYYLAAAGVRSIGISIAASNLDAGDVGKPVDSLVQASLLASGGAPIGTYFPSYGQYWLIMRQSPPLNASVTPGDGTSAGTTAATLSILGDAPNAQVGAPYAYAYTIAGGQGPYTVEVSFSTLPTGLVLSSDGIITGAGTTPMTSVFTVKVTDYLGATATLNDSIQIAALTWVHGDNGIAQTIYDAEIFNGVMITAGNNGSLSRSTDFGATWTVIPINTQINDNIGISDVWVEGGRWYVRGTISNGGSPAFAVYSSANGLSWTQTNTSSALGTNPGSGISVIDGVSWGYLYSNTNTKIKQTLTPDTIIDLGADYGIINTIAHLGGLYLAATDVTQAKILAGTSLSTMVTVATPGGGQGLYQFAYGNGIWLLASSTGNYYYSTNGTTWVTKAGQRYGIVFFNGVFYGCNTANILQSTDGINWTIVDSYLGTSSFSRIRTAENRILCVGFNNKTMTAVGI